MKSIIKIPMQSFSDVVTNSSSELFCTITSDNYLDDIYEVLKTILGDGYNETNFYVYKEKDEDTKQEYLCLEVEYDAINYLNLISAGIKSILDEGFKGKYNIKYETNS